MDEKSPAAPPAAGAEVVVPREPTPEMAQAAYEVHVRFNPICSRFVDDELAQTWAAMLGAAPALAARSAPRAEGDVEAMREACAKWHDERAVSFADEKVRCANIADELDGEARLVWRKRAASNEAMQCVHLDSADAIRALPHPAPEVAPDAAGLVEAQERTCLRCNGKGERETSGDHHRSAGVVFCSACKGRGTITTLPTPPDDTARLREAQAVDAFAAAMKEKLRHSREVKGRGRWWECLPQDLSRMLHEHVVKGDPIDVANFCMMLHDLGVRIAAPPTPSEDVDRLRAVVRRLTDRFHGATLTDLYEGQGVTMMELVRDARAALTPGSAA